MKGILKTLLLMMAFLPNVSNVFAQLGVPLAEAVYGGRINAITAISSGTNSSRIFISTESANSLFYADASVPVGTTPTYTNFMVLQGANAAAGYGSNIRSIAAHQVSGKVFFLNNPNLLSTAPSASTSSTVITDVNAFAIIGSTLVYTSPSQFKWGSLDAFGNFTINSSAPVASPITGTGITSIIVSKTDSLVYLFQEGSTPKLYVSSDKYNVLTSSTTFTDISPSALTPGYNWTAFGVAPDKRLFIGGTNFSSKYVAYSDNIPVWTEIAIGINGTSGPNFAFTGDSTNYTVYYASAYSDSSGTSSWHNFGAVGGFETHPNDGAVYTDPNNDSVVYMTTDQGIGASHSRGQNIYEIDNGVEAVQVKDIDMTSDKNTAWIASKSGIREVTNYQTTPVWTNAIFPNGDGSPYYSVAMKTGNPNIVYAGNLRVYKTTDAGINWSMAFT
ncbi:MAG: hypothetical protein K8R85_09670, partial [Bacteroidetes bacterium]|nr:hypothetical protein [Bacteroidota bacterium]